MEQIKKSTLHEKCPYSEFLWSVFSRIQIEYGKIRSMSPYLVRMRENTDQKNSEYKHSSHSDNKSIPGPFLLESSSILQQQSRSY